MKNIYSLRYGKAALCLLFLLFLIKDVFGQSPMTIESVALNQYATEYALVYLPLNYNPSKKYPLIMFYHGDGEEGSTKEDLAELYNNENAGGPAYFIANGEWPDSFYNYKDGKYYQFIVVEPQTNGWEPVDQRYVLASVVSKYSVDTNRIYMTGLSAGGWTLWNYCGHYQVTPTLKAAAIVPMSMATTPSSTDAKWIVSDSIRAWGFGDVSGDVWGGKTKDGIDLMNAIVPGIARFTSTHDRHSGWGKHYNPAYTEMINGHSMNIYNWMLLWQRGASTASLSPANQPPAADAGKDQVITLPANSVTLDGSGSSDGDGTIAKYQWNKKSGPAAFSIKSPSSAKTDVTGLAAGTYVFTLTVTDNGGGTSSGNVTITVNNSTAKPSGKPPEVFAGYPALLRAGETGYQLQGTAADPDGTVASVAWTQVFGPPATIASPHALNTDISGLTGGQAYRFRLSATDNSGNVSYAEVVVAVNTMYPDKQDTIISTTDPGYHLINIDFKQDPGYKRDTISILGGTYTYFEFQNLTGSPGNRVVIRPLGGPVTFTQPNKNGQAGVMFINCQYIHVDGRLPDATYGFQLVGLLDSRWGQVFITGRSKCMEVNNIYGHYMTYGFQIKKDPDCDPVSWNDNEAKTFVMDSFDLHNFYFDSTYYEGTYIGGTLNTSSTTYNGNGGYKVPCDGSTSYHFGYRMGHIKVHDGVITNTTNDGVQLVDVRYGKVEIYNITLKDIGVGKGDANQNHAMSLGGFMQADIHDNYIENAGFGIFLNGTGDITFRNDTIKNIVGGDAIYISNNWDTLYQVLNADSMVIRAYNNYINGANYGINLTNYDKLLATENQFYNNNISNTKYKDFTFNNDHSIKWQGQYGGGKLDTTLGARPYVTIQQVDIGSGSLTIHATASRGATIRYSLDGKKWQTDSTFTGLSTGWYIASAEITPWTRDNKNQIYVVNTGEENKPPVANAGNDTTLILPTNQLTLDGNSSFDPDGSIAGFLWQEVSGPSKLDFSKINAVTLKVSGLIEGTYIFQLTVTDNSGATSRDKVTVTVKTSGAGQAPVANAGEDITITLPENSVTLEGSGSPGSDGKIVSYQWKQKSGPSSGTINDADAAHTEVAGLAAGTYVFVLIITDNKGTTASNEVTIIVKPATNQSPVADAGTNILITLPQDSAILDGSTSYDPDGKIVKYKWEQVEGPSKATFISAQSSKCSIHDLAAGTYGFKLIITDNKGAVSTATVSVFVDPATDSSDTKFNIYPNPVHDQLHVQINKAVTGLIVFRILDINGRIIKVYNYGALPSHVTKDLDVSDLPEGVYFLQLIEDAQLGNTCKVIKY